MISDDYVEQTQWIHFAPEWPRQDHELDVALFVPARPEFGIEYLAADQVAPDASHLFVEPQERWPLEPLHPLLLQPQAPTPGDAGGGFVIAQPQAGEVTLSLRSATITIKTRGGRVTIVAEGEVE